jgi:hypothetical protein
MNFFNLGFFALWGTVSPKAGFPLGEFVRANKQKANVIGW